MRPREVPRGQTLEQIARSPPRIAGRAAVLADRTAPRYPPSRGQLDRGQRADRRGASAVLSPDFPDRLPGRPEPAAGAAFHGSRADGVDRPSALQPDFPCGPALRRCGSPKRNSARCCSAYQKSIYGALREVPDALADAYPHARTAGRRREAGDGAIGKRSAVDAAISRRPG